MKNNLCHHRAHAARGSNFLLLRQKKVTKEKVTPIFALIRYLERKRRAVRNSLRSNNEPLHRRFHSKSRNRYARGECRGRLFFGDFLLAKQKKVTAPRGMSALVANDPLHSAKPLTLTLSRKGRGD